jgi:hypothetical protein
MGRTLYLRILLFWDGLGFRLIGRIKEMNLHLVFCTGINIGFDGQNSLLSGSDHDAFQLGADLKAKTGLSIEWTLCHRQEPFIIAELGDLKWFVTITGNYDSSRPLRLMGAQLPNQDSLGLYGNFTLNKTIYTDEQIGLLLYIGDELDIAGIVPAFGHIGDSHPVALPVFNCFKLVCDVVRQVGFGRCNMERD